MRNERQQTPLHRAAMCGNVGMCEFLVREGAVVDVVDQDGETPLTLGICRGHTAVVATLIGLGAEKNRPDKYAFYPIQRASMHGHLDMLQLLESLDMYVEAKDVTETPLALAKLYHHDAIIRFLNRPPPRNTLYLTQPRATEYSVAFSIPRLVRVEPPCALLRLECIEPSTRLPMFVPTEYLDQLFNELPLLTSVDIEPTRENIEGGVPTPPITGLKRSTMYVFRLCAMNEIGETKGPAVNVCTEPVNAQADFMKSTRSLHHTMSSSAVTSPRNNTHG
eukprot:GDKI01011464.1.p1 GENE.GDKI01011464.1~~GDKI01011464.1.p1  ORF type:complete len:278 (-),score=22.03 GDKI01011464.1:21-854(-)